MKKSMTAKISIITVVYNSKDTIEQTILSVINQRYNNIEYIIKDGGSTDGTIDVINKYKESVAQIITGKDGGIYDAMNIALEHVTGDWVYFLGSGDLALNVFDKIAPQLTNHKSVYYGDVYRTDLLKVFNGPFSKLRSTRMCICHQAILYPVDAIKKYGFDTQYKVQADHNLNMMIYGDRAYTFTYINVVISIYEGDGFSAITRDELFFKNRLSIVRANFPWYAFMYAKMIDYACKVTGRGEYRNKTT